ncbi:MAG: hypothetical protein U9O98_07585, partial [Asgard group archaeon]|nr:hypothetical protein [Asgard group archaeon]
STSIEIFADERDIGYVDGLTTELRDEIEDPYSEIQIINIINPLSLYTVFSLGFSITSIGLVIGIVNRQKTSSKHALAGTILNTLFSLLLTLVLYLGTVFRILLL